MLPADAISLHGISGCRDFSSFGNRRDASETISRHRTTRIEGAPVVAKGRVVQIADELLGEVQVFGHVEKCALRRSGRDVRTHTGRLLRRAFSDKASAHPGRSHRPAPETGS